MTAEALQISKFGIILILINQKLRSLNQSFLTVLKNQKKITLTVKDLKQLINIKNNMVDILLQKLSIIAKVISDISKKT